MAKKREISEISKREKIEYLKANGWYELKERNNWVESTKIPKKWKGLPLEEAFIKFYENNKRKIK